MTIELLEAANRRFSLAVGKTTTIKAATPDQHTTKPRTLGSHIKTTCLAIAFRDPPSPINRDLRALSPSLYCSTACLQRGQHHLHRSPQPQKRCLQ
ncbi:hypothetical protein ACLB2K_025450 [Fragaria x ananassa]